MVQRISRKLGSKTTSEIKLLAVLMDIITLLALTGHQLDTCERGVPVATHFSFGTLMFSGLAFLVLSSGLLLYKFCFNWIRSTSSCKQHFTWLNVTYDIVNVIMGVCFLVGDNLSDAICIDFNTSECEEKVRSMVPINSTTCMRIPKPEMDTLPKCNIITCRQISIGFLGVSTVINLSLLYSELYCVKNLKELMTSPGWHTVWTQMFDLLSHVLIFDQSLSGLFDTIFRLTRNESLLCPENGLIHGSAATVYGISVVIWLVLVCTHASNNLKDLKTTKSKWSPFIPYYVIPYYVISLILICLFYIIYIFADTSWPWDCFSVNENCKKAGLQGRTALLVFSLLIFVPFYAAYIGISFCPSLCMMRNAEPLNCEECILMLPKTDDEMRVEGEQNLAVNSKYETTPFSANYSVDFTRVYSWWHCCPCTCKSVCIPKPSVSACNVHKYNAHIGLGKNANQIDIGHVRAQSDSNIQFNEDCIMYSASITKKVPPPRSRSQPKSNKSLKNRTGINWPLNIEFEFMKVDLEDDQKSLIMGRSKDYTLLLIPHEDTPTDTSTKFNTPKDTPADTLKDTPADTPTDTSADNPTNTPKDASPNTPKDALTNTPKDSPTNTPKDSPTNTPKDAPTNTPKDAPTNTPKVSPTNTPKDASTNTPKDAPTNTPKDSPTKFNTPADTPTIRK